MATSCHPCLCLCSWRDLDFGATANQTRIRLWLAELRFELLARWRSLSCSAANHPSLGVKRDGYTEVFQHFRHLKGNSLSTPALTDPGDILTLGLLEFLTLQKFRKNYLLASGMGLKPVRPENGVSGLSGSQNHEARKQR